MNKYQEELNQIIKEYNYLGDLINDLSKYTEYPTVIQKDLLQALIDEKTEFESRKDKLAVGSLWVCMVECYISSSLIIKGVEVEILDFDADIVYFEKVNLTFKGYLTLEPFFLHFKPVEREN